MRDLTEIGRGETSSLLLDTKHKTRVCPNVEFVPLRLTLVQIRIRFVRVEKEMLLFDAQNIENFSMKMATRLCVRLSLLLSHRFVLHAEFCMPLVLSRAR